MLNNTLSTLVFITEHYPVCTDLTCSSSSLLLNFTLANFILVLNLTLSILISTHTLPLVAAELNFSSSILLLNLTLASLILLLNLDLTAELYPARLNLLNLALFTWIVLLNLTLHALITMLNLTLPALILLLNQQSTERPEGPAPMMQTRPTIFNLKLGQEKSSLYVIKLGDTKY